MLRLKGTGAVLPLLAFVLVVFWVLGGQEGVGDGASESIKEPKIKYPGAPAYNGRCYVCHINFEDEKLAATHFRANVGCVICHGESDSHCTDEDNITAPERLYPNKGRIRLLCLRCHDWRSLIESDKDKKSLKEPPDHKAVLEGSNKDKKFCLDCHGEHKLAHRTRRWNKRTRELIERDGAPNMVKKNDTNNLNGIGGVEKSK